MIITDNDTLWARYHHLGRGDIVVGRVRLKPCEEPLLLDLHQRGVLLIPSAVSQMVSRLKSVQARLLSGFMVPNTRVVYDLHDLQAAITAYGQAGVTRVVTKHDRRNAGMGIHLWASIEEVYTQASFGVLPLPFVVQPHIAGCRDIRVIIIDNYLEAYWRHNPDNFRNNLHFGGSSSPCDPTPEQQEICARVMERACFPYAHLDLMVTPEGRTWLAEINLGGGIRGARIKPAEYQARVEAVHRQLLAAASAA